LQSEAVSIEAAELRDECRLFSRYLVGRDPDAYVLGRYVSLQPAALKGAPALAPLDALLLKTARSSLFGLRIADAYARIFRPRCLLRRKLILTFAILENSRGFHSRFTSGVSSSYVLALVRIAAAVMGFGLALTASVFVIGPRAVLAGWQSRRSTS
jgi:hypothetical protein